MNSYEHMQYTYITTRTPKLENYFFQLEAIGGGDTHTPVIQLLVDFGILRLKKFQPGVSGPHL